MSAAREWAAAPPTPPLGAVLREDRARMAAALEAEAPALAGARVLVTGAGGLLPSYVLHALCALNEGPLRGDPCEVLALTRRPSSGPLASEPWIQWLVRDAREPLPWDVRFQYALCGASAASPKAYLADPVGTLMSNGQGLAQVLERAWECRAAGVLFLSSGELYGSPPADACPTPEGFQAPLDPLSPRACYVEGKRFGEALCAAWARSKGLRAVIARPFQVFGPGLREGDGRAFADFLWAAHRGEALVLRSSGSARRSYCYVADAAVAFVQLMVRGEGGEAYNVGSSSPEVTILELARSVAALASAGSAVVVQGQSAEGEGSPARTCPDVEKIGRALGWAPTTSLEEGLRRTLAWLKEEER
jgi:UDP-glucuronate decarboxylase